jgi:hypothetical protein
MTKFLPNLLLICLCTVIAYSTQAQGPGYSWIRPANGTGSDAAKDIVISKDHSLYTCGNFSSATLQLGSFSLSNAGGTDVYVAKYDTSGNIIWAKNYGGSGNDAVQSITTDSLNNIYITGTFTGTVSLGALNFPGGNYVLKLNNLGNEVWAINPAANATVTDIAADPTGQTVVCGYFNSGAVTIGNQSVTTTAGDDGFLAAFDANGTFNWYRQVYSSRTAGTNYNLFDKCLTVTVSASGLIAFAGEFAGNDKLFFRSNIVADSITPNMFVDPQRGICPQAAFAACINTNNGFLWAKDNISMFGNSGRCWSTVHHAAISVNNDVYFSATTLNRSSTIAYDYSTVVKYNSSGAMQWIASASGQFVSPIVIGLRQPALALDKDSGYVYMVEKELGSGSYTSNESRIQCYDSFGNLRWSSVFTGSAFSGGNSFSDITALTVRKNVYAAGKLLSTKFANLTAAYSGYGDGYLAKLDYYVAPLPPLELSSPLQDITICPGGTAYLASGTYLSSGLQPYTYNWLPATALSNPAILNPSATPTATTTYILTVTDMAGRILRDTVLVTVRPPLAKPTIQLIPLTQGTYYDTLICNSTETNLVYKWNNEPTLNGPKILAYSYGTYYVTIAKPFSGCTSTSDLFYYKLLKANAGRDTTVCAGQSLTLGGTPPHFGTSVGNVRYTWYSYDAGYFGTPNISNPYITITPTVTANYFLAIMDESNNSKIGDTVRITVNAQPNLGTDTLIYHNCYLETTNLLPLYNTTGLTAAWNTATPTIAAPGLYRLVVNNGAGCSDTAFTNIKLEVATWTGTLSSDWHTAGNWNINKVPTALTHVIIYSGTPNNCTIGTANAVAASVQLRNGAVLNMNNGMTVRVVGNCAVLPPN